MASPGLYVSVVLCPVLAVLPQFKDRNQQVASWVHGRKGQTGGQLFRTRKLYSCCVTLNRCPPSLGLCLIS